MSLQLLNFELKCRNSRELLNASSCFRFWVATDPKRRKKWNQGNSGNEHRLRHFLVLNHSITSLTSGFKKFYIFLSFWWISIIEVNDEWLWLKAMMWRLRESIINSSAELTFTAGFNVWRNFSTSPFSTLFWTTLRPDQFLNWCTEKCGDKNIWMSHRDLSHLNTEYDGVRLLSTVEKCNKVCMYSAAKLEKLLPLAKYFSY